jgi:hypothetical protein
MYAIVFTPMAVSTSLSLPLNSVSEPLPKVSNSGVPEISFEAEALDGLCQSSDPHAAYWKAMMADGPGAMVPNFSTRAGVARLGQSFWPLTVDGGSHVNSYPCSLFAQYVRYPLAELKLVPSRAQRIVARLALHLLGGMLKVGQVDRVVQWSSWLLSTNLHSTDAAMVVTALTRTLTAQFPSHAILIKNVHGFEDKTLASRLKSDGYDLITSRQIYFFDGRCADFLERSTVKKDLKALAQLRDYTVLEHEDFTAADVPRITSLYRQLYLEKHSFLNPQYTERFVERALRERLLEFRGLRHSSGRVDGVFACFSREQTTSTPFIGYDTTLPVELGLYRHLVSILLQRVAERKLILNYSSGAGDFKRRRGGQAVIEYNAVYTRHLGPVRRAVFGVMGWLLNRFGRRFLEENKI